jgi:hypothetical protein
MQVERQPAKGGTVNKWIPIVLGVAILALIGLAIVSDFDGFDRHDGTQVDRVVTTENGETLIIRDDDDRGFFPFGFFIFPFFWFFVIATLFWVFRRGPWRGFGPPGAREAWFDDWHRRAHQGPSGPPDSAERPSDQS